MLQCLASLKISHQLSVPEAMIKVYEAMAEDGYIKFLDVQVLNAWLTDLRDLGYKFPNVRRSSEPFKLKSTEIVDQRGDDEEREFIQKYDKNKMYKLEI